MKRWAFLPSLLLAFLLGLISTSLAQENEADFTLRPDSGGEPTIVTIRVIVLDLDDISGANQTYTANVAYRARWQDDRLIHKGPADRKVKLSEIWHPGIQILNRQRLQETFEEEARISPSGEVEIVQRVWGQFSQPLELHDFPFDHQLLEFNLVGAGNDPGTVKFVGDAEAPSRIADTFSISDWAVENWEAGETELSLVQGDRPVPMFQMWLKMKRNSGYHLINNVLPMVMIICMSWVVFWVPPSNMGPRISVSVTTMLTLTAYRFAIGATLPRIAYLTKMDWFILGSSLLIFMSLLQVVVTTYLAENEKLTLARRINQVTRGVAPVAFVLVFYFSLF